MSILAEALAGAAACAAICWGYVTFVMYLVYSALGFPASTSFTMAATFLWHVTK